MRFLLLTLCLLLSGCGSFKAKPYDQRYTVAPRIWWTLVDDAEDECIRRGVKPVGPFETIYACAVMSKKECEIITNRNTTMEILGHETRHCFEGNFHD